MKSLLLNRISSMKPSDRCTILRLVFALCTLHVWYAGVFEPNSFHFAVNQPSFGHGMLLINCFGFLGALSLADIVANDIFNGLKLSFLVQVRHLVLMTTALLFASELFVASFHVVPWGLIIYNMIACSSIACAAFKDMHLRCPDKPYGT